MSVLATFFLRTQESEVKLEALLSSIQAVNSKSDHAVHPKVWPLK